MLTVFIIELFFAFALFKFIMLFSKKYIFAFAICACIFGLIFGWIGGYRGTGYAITMATIKNADASLKQEQGRNITRSEENEIKENLFNTPEFKKSLYKTATNYSLVSFLFVLIIMLIIAYRKKNQILLASKLNESSQEGHS